MKGGGSIQVGQISSLKEIRSVYFIGIGGIGMSAIARYFLSKGMHVSGYDRSRTALTMQLEKEGINIHYEENISLIPKDVDLVVYTPAVPAEHAELGYFRKNGNLVVKRSDVLQSISAETFNICVAGTHGKTTISTMIAHILRHSGMGCNAFLGGISVNYETNFWNSTNNVCVIEADEYDRSFLKLSPDISVISSMDADHLDIYGNHESMQDAFVAFADKTKEGGVLISRFGLKRIKEVKVKRRLTYSLQNDVASIYGFDIQIEEGGYRFNVQLQDKVLSNLELRLGGMHNVENMVAAIAVADELQIDEEKIRAAVAGFRGVRRRFEYVIPPGKKQEGGFVHPVLIDDYAHHPEELKALLNSVRSLFPGRLITVIFQPHLFTRTRDLAEGFADSLQIADRVVLLPIYPARELPIEGVTSKMVLDKIEKDEKILLAKEELAPWASNQKWNKEFGEVIVMAGAGDIDAMVGEMKMVVDRFEQ